LSTAAAAAVVCNLSASKSGQVPSDFVKGRDAVAIIVTRPLAPASYQRIQGIDRPAKELAPGPAHGQERLDCTACGRGCFEYVITNVPARTRLPVAIAKTAIAIHDLTLEDAFDRRHQFLRDRVGCSRGLDGGGPISRRGFKIMR
jgi:hypothetical protein